MSRPPLRKIGIPDGDFTADLVFPVCIIEWALSEEFEVVRLPHNLTSRDSECDFLLGIGGCYNHERHRYDYHQVPIKLRFPRSSPDSTCMATSGLVYYHFGREALWKILQTTCPDDQDPLPPDFLDFHYESLYTQFVQEIDGLATGAAVPKNKNYEICTGIWNRVAELNCHWRTPDPDVAQAFASARRLVEEEFVNLVKRGRTRGYKEYCLTEEAYRRREDTDPSRKIIELAFFFPCYPYLLKFERDSIQQSSERSVIDRAKVLFMIYRRPTTGSWTVRGISSGRGFVQRKKLPLWNPQQIPELAKITDMKFIHNTGLMGIFESRDSALKFARIALTQPDDA
jgi:uncharacterized UPF0160 family protein